MIFRPSPDIQQSGPRRAAFVAVAWVVLAVGLCAGAVPPAGALEGNVVPVVKGPEPEKTAEPAVAADESAAPAQPEPEVPAAEADQNEGALAPLKPAPAVASPAGAPAEAAPVEINGDRVEFSMNNNKALAEGNVSVIRGDVTLLCDRMEYDRNQGIAVAQGNVVLIRGTERLTGDKLKFNFVTMQGDFEEARVTAEPFYGTGRKIIRVDEKHLQIEEGHITTCDLHKPHFQLVAKKIDIYPQEKAVSRNVRMLVGRVPLVYLPRLTQDLTGKEPSFLITPGYKNTWGSFFLSYWGYRINDDVKGKVHFDVRSKTGIGSGADLDYKTDKYGSGIIRTYYTHEEKRNSKFFFDEDDTAGEELPEKERFRGQWRHQVNIDNQTSAIWQYYKLSDSEFLQDYYEREYEDDISPTTYFLLSRTMPAGTLSFRNDVRVNRFDSMVERLPEINFDMPAKEIVDTGFFWKNTTTYSNLNKKSASPSEIRQKTMRVDTDNELSYPMKVAFIELKPFVGGRETYYSKTTDPADYGIMRGIFRTGADLSTKFFRIYEAESDWLGIEVNRLRHVITPSIAYDYVHDPTVANSKLDQFDSVDALNRSHALNFSIENKLQTKRNLKSVDLARLSLGSLFLLKEDPGRGGFNNVTADIDLTPYDWLALYMDSSYDTIEERLSTANVDLYLHKPDDRWYVSLGKRFNVEVDDQITAEVGMRLNPKWKVRAYQRFDVDSGTDKEFEINLSRDLHCWLMDINYNHTRGEGDEIWLVFTMKAFPDIGLDFGSNFNRRKPGVQ